MPDPRYRPAPAPRPRGQGGTGWDTWHRDRKSELPEDWYLRGGTRDQVIARDKGVCQWQRAGVRTCLKPGVVVDHIGDPHDHSLRNLRLLCRHHNEIRTSQQGVDARRAARARPTERHPFHRLAEDG